MKELIANPETTDAKKMPDFVQKQSKIYILNLKKLKK